MTPTRLRITLILGALAAFAPMSIDMYLPALPAIGRSLGADTASVQLTLSAFFIGLAFGQAMYGPLADRFGRKGPLYFGLIVYIAASIGCALAADIEALIGLRLMQALGGCVGIVIARAVVRDLYGHQESARMFSVLMLVMGVAPILAPLLGGYVLIWLGWRAIFWVLALFGLSCLIAAALILPETRPAHTMKPNVFSAIVGYGRLLVDRRFIGYTLAGGLAQAGLFAYISGSPFVFIEVFGVPAQHYGWLFGLNALGLIVASQINRRLLSRNTPDELLKRANLANALFGIALAGIALSGIGGLPLLLLPLFGYVAALGFTFPNAAAGALAPFGDRAGSASALLGSVQFGIAAVAGAAVGLLHDDTAMPMAAVICVCGVAALAAHRALVRQ
ncbi:MAG TPA: Bcr/CflA family multidrug efflux MFS transporter [Burkholderiales bacterium]|nr:Bcr/CflA family multidrug efflux MFS transporter [Burkholderiales bacterium]